ncbi:hypothetical protein LTR48_002535 [Friedmanniomyces endolithicus]|uniref:Zn(2)-C6 fungal-type domain-containing protein n=1 Tax=Rachicladosporium monterosium TaxID=1507873 RepID=A0ABR0LAP4_9PEZI|nr:hypothetical protein LTR29_011354 [Friedmanniomyces endolithicus]KAK1093340.1 hypothetical protein LTR48_002535 [Friedmanniomyces endolithicus]KAK5146051.1 hypothetical protein LTR32_002306 [Rachicladosporium monterosium]
MSEPNTNHRKRSPSPLADDTPGDGQQGRQRSRAACTPCRQRKRKCDGRYPCGTCVRYEYECIFATTPTTTTTQKRLSYAAAANGDVAPELMTRSPEVAVRTTPSIIHLQKHPLTAPGARFHHRSMMDPVKTRFVRANSAIAFPRILGMDLESESIPRLHSFAWHCGIRAEVLEPVVDVTTLLSWPDLTRLAKVYFRVVNTEFGILDETDFLELSAARFGNSQGLNDVDAVLLGVVALGSFFSPNGHPKEHDFVLGARDLLTQKSVNHPTTNNVTGWILRTIYLRLTSRPHGAWISSSIAMHQVEGSGLHKEVQTIAVVYPALPTGDHKVAKARRRLFWVARALNIVLSFEYGRSRVGFDVITTKRFAPDHGGFAHQFVELAELLPNDFVDREREPDPPGSLCTALTKIEDLKTDSACIQLLKADLTFAIYRRLWLMSLTDAKDRADSVLSIGRAALEASARLLETKTSWWNLVHAPFQFLCCVLAIATPRALAHVKDAMALLHRIAQTYDTHMTREAYNQAAILVQMSRRRKEKELQALNAVPEPPPFNDENQRSSSVGGSSSVGLTDIPNFDWAMDLPFEWETFLNPELVMSSMQQVQGQSQALPPILMHAGSYESQGSYGNESLQYRASQGA